MATLADLNYVRDYVGMDEPTDGEIYVLVDETGTAPAAAQRILQRRLASLLNGPSSFSVDGYSESNSETIKALTATLNTLEGITGVGGDDLGVVKISQLTRPGRCRR